MEFKDFVGKTFIDIQQTENEVLIFTTKEGEVFKMVHSQDCCEQVYIESIVGSLKDLIGTPILNAEEATNRETPPKDHVPESFTLLSCNAPSFRAGM